MFIMKLSRNSRFRLRRAKPYLTELSNLSNHPRKQNLILKNRVVLLTLCEILWNLVNETVPLTPEVVGRLKSLRDSIVVLLNKKTPLKKKRQLLLNQKGGQPLLGTILALGLPVITELLKKAISS